MSDKNLFRQKSIKKMQSPDNLKEYIKVINPSLWIVFVATFLLLVGALVWGSVGKIEDKITVTAVSNGGVVTCEYNEQVKTGMKAVINGVEGTVGAVTSFGINLEFNGIPDGVYPCYVVVGEISPISFVLN